MSDTVCLIAFRPTPTKEGQEPSSVPASVVGTAFARHPHGTGLAYRRIENGRPVLVVERFGPEHAALARAAIARVDASGVEYAAHWRLATSGPKDAQHAHPYTYDDPDPEVGMVAVFHNGVISIAHDQRRESDTETFVNLVLATLPSRWWANPAMVYLVGEAIGYSKLLIMTADESVRVNGSYGHWTDGVWYSSDEKPYRSYTVSNSTWASNKGWKGYTPTLPASTTASVAPPVPHKAPADTGHTLTDVIRGRKARRERRRRQREQAMSKQHAALSGGHTISFLTPINRNANCHYPDAVQCETCDAYGDVYTIAQGQGVYVDITHNTGGAS